VSEPCIHSWTFKRGSYFGEPVLFKRCRICKCFRWKLRDGKHLERRRATVS
jgi:hypothetical protein